LSHAYNKDAVEAPVILVGLYQIMPIKTVKSAW